METKIKAWDKPTSDYSMRVTSIPTFRNKGVQKTKVPEYRLGLKECKFLPNLEGTVNSQIIWLFYKFEKMQHYQAPFIRL